ncbi:NAD(P)H-dependent oxidoreductase [Candidatus Pacearchaeota archaeon]|nr:NAD(P)H-dependent oxidoreductase [Candidatus Pacearchaeota archaeon]
MKILTILAHPSKDSFNHALLRQYIKGTKQNHQVKTIYLGDLKFDPILHEGYKKIQTLEPDLLDAQKKILWADKITIFTPIWWTTPPALFKGFIERTLHPTFAFNNPSGNKYEKLLKGRNARIIATMDAPLLYYKFIVGDPLYKQMKGTLSFCGISPIQKTYISSLKFKTNKQTNEILKQIYKVGLNEK